jgi:hypothetical protein
MRGALAIHLPSIVRISQTEIDATRIGTKVANQENDVDSAMLAGG